MSRGVDFWGAAEHVRLIKAMLVHRTLTEEVTEEHLLALARSRSDPLFPHHWDCRSVRMLGPMQGDGSFDPHRLTVFLTADRRVTDVGVG